MSALQCDTALRGAVQVYPIRGSLPAGGTWGVRQPVRGECR